MDPLCVATECVRVFIVRCESLWWCGGFLLQTPLLQLASSGLLNNRHHLIIFQRVLPLKNPFM